MLLRRISLISAFTAFWVPLSMSHAEPSYYKDTETLSYAVIETLSDDTEIRHYEASMAVESSGNQDTGAFRLLFNYISGENKTNTDVSMTSPVEVGNNATKISMTSPVEMSSSDKMMFFLPSKYSAENAPVPTHEDVSLVTVPARTVAAIRYSGLNGDDKKEEFKNKLLKTLSDNNIKAVGAPSYMGYDSPFTLPWNKRHEIIVPVEIK